MVVKVFKLELKQTSVPVVVAGFSITAVLPQLVVTHVCPAV